MFLKEYDRYVVCTMYFDKHRYGEMLKKIVEDFGIDFEEVFVNICESIFSQKVDKDELLRGNVDKLIDPVIGYFYTLPIDVRVVIKWLYDVDVNKPSHLKEVLLKLITSNPDVNKHLIEVEKFELEKNIIEIAPTNNDPILAYFSTLPLSVRTLIKNIYNVDVKDSVHLKEVLLKLIISTLKPYFFKRVKEVVNLKDILHQRYGYLSCPFCGNNHNFSKQKRDRAGYYVTYCYFRKIKFILHRKSLINLKKYGIFTYDKKGNYKTFTKRFTVRDLRSRVPLSLLKNLSFYCPFCDTKHEVEIKGITALKVFCPTIKMDIVFYDIDDVVNSNPYFRRCES